MGLTGVAPRLGRGISFVGGGGGGMEDQGLRPGVQGSGWGAHHRASDVWWRSGRPDRHWSGGEWRHLQGAM